MADYKKMYFCLFRSITNAIDVLQKAQLEAEEIFTDISCPEITLLNKPDGRENRQDDK